MTEESSVHLVHHWAETCRRIISEYIVLALKLSGATVFAAV